MEGRKKKEEEFSFSSATEKTNYPNIILIQAFPKLNEIYSGRTLSLFLFFGGLLSRKNFEKNPI